MYIRAGREVIGVKHEVKFGVPQRSLGRADIRFDVSADKAAMGSLLVSNGSVVWFPKHSRRGLKLFWRDLDSLMQQHGKPVERR